MNLKSVIHLLWDFLCIQGQILNALESKQLSEFKYTSCSSVLRFSLAYHQTPLPLIENEPTNGFLCDFARDSNDLCGSSDLLGARLFCGQGEYADTQWKCWIKKQDKCDAYSQCLTDECNCGTDVFKCADGVGCIARANLCDGYTDCLDGSDECMCGDILECYIDQKKQCVPKELYCKGKHLTYSSCKVFLILLAHQNFHVLSGPVKWLSRSPLSARYSPYSPKKQILALIL